MSYLDARSRELDEAENDIAIIAVALTVFIALITIFFVSVSSSHSHQVKKPTTQATQSHQAQTSHTSMSINPGGPVRGLKTHS